MKTKLDLSENFVGSNFSKYRRLPNEEEKSIREKRKDALRGLILVYVYELIAISCLIVLCVLYLSIHRINYLRRISCPEFENKISTNTLNPENFKKLSRFWETGYCHYIILGHTNYRLCYNKDFSVYHDDETQAELLGAFDKQRHALWYQNNFSEECRSQDSLTFFYGRGQFCQSTGQNTTTLVHLKCDKNLGAYDTLTEELSETSPCQYLLQLSSPMVCDLLPFVSKQGLIETERIEDSVKHLRQQLYLGSDESSVSKIEEEQKEVYEQLIDCIKFNVSVNWHFRFCYNNVFEQYFVGDEGDWFKKTVLGKFDVEENKRWIIENKKQPLPPESRSYVSQLYVDGGVCNRRRDHFSTEVVFACNPNEERYDVDALEGCRQRLTLEGPRICYLLPLADEFGIFSYPATTKRKSATLSDDVESPYQELLERIKVALHQNRPTLQGLILAQPIVFDEDTKSDKENTEAIPDGLDSPPEKKEEVVTPALEERFGLGGGGYGAILNNGLGNFPNYPNQQFPNNGLGDQYPAGGNYQQSGGYNPGYNQGYAGNQFNGGSNYIAQNRPGFQNQAYPNLYPNMNTYQMFNPPPQYQQYQTPNTDNFPSQYQQYPNQGITRPGQNSPYGVYNPNSQYPDDIVQFPNN